MALYEVEARRKSIEKLLLDSAQRAETRDAAVEEILFLVAEEKSKQLSAPLAALYKAALVELTTEQIVSAMTSALLELRMFPTVADVLRLASASSSTTETRARAALGDVLSNIRDFGPLLMSKRGPVVADRDEEGRRLVEPIYGEPRLARAMSAEIWSCLRIVGFQSWTAATQILAQHSSVTGPHENMNRVDADVERRWLTSWREMESGAYKAEVSA